MDSCFFFRVEHDLLRSEAFKTLGGSAIKVYLVIGFYADFETGWAYPSIRTIARQAGLSRQTVLAAIAELTRAGLLASRKTKGRSTAYKIIRQAPAHHASRVAKSGRGRSSRNLSAPGPESFGPPRETVPISLDLPPQSVPESFEVPAQDLGRGGPGARPKQEPGTREDSTSIAIPGTPFRLTADGRLLVAVDLQELLTNQGIPRRLAERLATQKAPEDVAKVLLNALYLQSQGKLQNGPGYIRAGIEDGYDLLPQVAHRLESRRRQLEAHLRQLDQERQRRREQEAQAAEEAAVEMVLSQLGPSELQRLVQRAVAELPEPIVRRNPTLSNPFVRAKVFELAGGEPPASS